MAHYCIRALLGLEAALYGPMTRQQCWAQVWLVRLETTRLVKP